jgi:hypothetical protein
LRFRQSPINFFADFGPVSVAYKWALVKEVQQVLVFLRRLYTFGTYTMTDGAEGIEPPQEYKDLLDLFNQGPLVGDADRAEIGKEIYRRLAEAQYTIGVAGLSPMIQGVIVKNKDLRNVPDAAANSWPHRTPNTGFPEQWYYDR